ncbi:hypothetical protein BKA69DRAFT_797540 [Paraphysoderma sedebokerense]|nr:hypothetical protein BKA69DRAFT_797540 [Paraphysoderma sedebokerense]
MQRIPQTAPLPSDDSDPHPHTNAESQPLVLASSSRSSSIPALAMSNQPILQQPAAPMKPILQPSFAVDLPAYDAHHGIYEGMVSCFGGVLGFFGSIPCCLCCPNPFRIVDQGSVGLISKFGKCTRVVDPGLHQINLMTETIRTVDIKIQISDIPRQYVMTKDNVGINIDSVIYWHVVDPYATVFLVSNVQSALVERTQTTLRHIFGTRSLQECIENRETIAVEIQRLIDEPAKSWGVKIESVLIKDLQLTAELLETLSSAAKQKRIGESKVIAAEAEVSAAKLMREASDILNTPAAMQIRYLETVTTMAKSAGSKVIFMPISQDAPVSNMLNEVNVTQGRGK